MAILIGAMVTGVVIWFAMSQPWLGMKLSPAPNGIGAVVIDATGPSGSVPVGTILVRIASSEDAMEIEAGDLLREPDGVIPDYDRYRDFIARQDRMAKIQAADEIFFTNTGGAVYRVEPRIQGRPFYTLPPDFWVGLLVGLVAWLVSSGVFAFRPGEPSARYLLLSGAATLVFAPAAVLYTTRELAMDGTLFRWASDLNFFGGSMFAASFVALLLYYPRRMAPRWLGIAIVGLYALWFVAQQVGLFESKIFARRFLVMLGVGATFVLAGIHAIRTRRDPVARAALQWFLLSWVLGTGLFALFILLPQTFGVDTTPLQGYAFLLFLLVYGGLAFGILRYRLFDLGLWWRRIAVWTACVVLLIVLDAFLLFVLHLSTTVSLSIALLVCGVVWLPLRAWVWRRFTARQDRHEGEIFGRVMDVALAPSGGPRNAMWKNLLGSIFDPLEITEHVDKNHADIFIVDDGQVLAIPMVGTDRVIHLKYARGGRALFTPQDVAMARELVTMLAHGIESLASYQKGVAEERSRIARDMHDNIGAQLLSALHSRDVSAKDAKIRETLADLREVINHATDGTTSLDETLAELRHETAERLDAAGMKLEWSTLGCDQAGVAHSVSHSLRSIIREAVSNAIRHAAASMVTVAIRLDDGTIDLTIADDGCGLDALTSHEGQGLANIRTRVDQLQGSFKISNQETGTRLIVRIPVYAPLP